MKILYIVLKGMPLGGGIEKYTEEVGSRLVRMGHEVTVYVMRHYGASDGEYKGMRIKSVPTLRKKSLEKMSASFMASVAQIREKNVDIVHMHAFGPAMFGFIPRLLGRKVVTQGHGLEWKRSKWSRAGRMFLKMTEVPSVRCAHALTAVSRVQQEYILKEYGRECVYLPTGVNPPSPEIPELIRRYGLDGQDYILFAARLVREKGAHYLINAYNRLQTDVKLVIAGDAEHEEKYKAELRKIAGGNANILFPGFVTGKELHELFTNCRFFVLPSEIEGLPTALLEAMSYGNCVLASDIPENLEALSGFGHTFRNMDVVSLADKMQYLLTNDQALELNKKKAQEYVLANHSWDAIAAQFESFYKGLLNHD